MDTTIQEGLRGAATRMKDPAGRDVEILDEGQALALARSHGASLHAIYVQALRLGICPSRYLRNRETVSVQEQLRLAESQVAVVGAGGLGGWVLSLLGRIGVGRLVVVDDDVFDETNLNRQAFAYSGNLGKAKAEEACSEVARINPGVLVTAHRVRLDRTNAAGLLADCQVVVDALDNVQSRLALDAAARVLGIPLVHGALAGFEGQVLTVLPGDEGLRQIYGDGVEAGRKPIASPEAVLGVPGITPCFIAALQAMEVIKILLNRGTVSRNVMVYMDLERGELNRFTL